ncbi:MAG: 2-oxo acid dehydrogenase subunit E2 [Chloroflexi bacterium]|nr:2-oxo acid dehydrogenase subunit E2 [Chloroflexota bacterium]
MADTVIMPKLGFDMAEGALVRWVIGEGQPVAKGAVLAEIETDKATVEVESAYEGVLARHLVHQGDIVPINTPIAIIAAPGEQVSAEAPAEAVAAPPQPAQEQAEPMASAQETAALPAPQGRVIASPLARRIAQEKGLDLQAIPGSGPGGRVVKADVENFRSGGIAAQSEAGVQAESSLPAALPVQPSAGVPLTRLRSAISRRMSEAKQRVPHFYVTHQYDMAAVMALRQQVNALLPDDQKTSVNDYILKAVSLALREFPNLNASLDEAGGRVIQHGQVNIGVAVAVEGGLLTVVCQEADRKPLRQIAGEVRGMASRAREGRVRPEDIQGSTFSISNLGMFDVESFIAIINPPEAAILAVGSVREIPVMQDGQVATGLRMNATLSVDHRVSDGAEAARFLQALEKYLSEPLRLLL